MIKIASYVPYIYKSSNVKNIKKIYNKIKTKTFIDFVNFSKGLYFYLCCYPNRCDIAFISFTKIVFSDLTTNELQEWGKRDMCMLMLLYIKCKKECSTFHLERRTIDRLHTYIEENIDLFDEDDFSTVLTFLNFTNDYKLYSEKNEKKNEVNRKITKEIIRRSHYYVSCFRQLKNVCILYSYLSRENISVELNNIFLKKIFQNVNKCKGTDLTNLIFNFYYINNFFFHIVMRKLEEIWNINDDIKRKEESFDHDENEIYNINTCNEFNDFIQIYESNYLHKINGNNLFNIYNCNIYMFNFINAYNNIFVKGKIQKLKDQCNYVDNIWKNCRLMYEFYTFLKQYVNTRNNYLNNIDVDMTKEEFNLSGKHLTLYSDINDKAILKIFFYVYKNGINYYQHYFIECRDFLQKYIGNMLRDLKNLKQYKRRKIANKDIMKEIKNEHVNILLNVLNQINAQDIDMYYFFMEHFKRNKNYSMKITLSLLQFVTLQNVYNITNIENSYFILFQHLSKIYFTVISKKHVPNNYGIIFLPPYMCSNNTYALYIQIFVKSVMYYLDRQEKACHKKKKHKYSANDELLYFGLYYNILIRQTDRPNTFLQHFYLKDLRTLRKFLQEFENAIKTDFSNRVDKKKISEKQLKLDKVCGNDKNTKKTATINFFFLKKSNIRHSKDTKNNFSNILKYIDISFNQRKNEYINYFYFFKMYNNYVYNYKNYGSMFYAPSVAPSIIIHD